jgi:hypothetical protein
MPTRYREAAGGPGDAAIMRDLIATARAGGSAALMQTLLHPNGQARYRGLGASPGIRMRQLARHSSDPMMRAAATRRRVEARGDLVPFRRRPAAEEDYHDPQTTECGVCGGRVPIGFAFCACGAQVPPVDLVGTRGMTRSRRGDPVAAKLEMQARRIAGGW